MRYYAEIEVTEKKIRRDFLYMTCDWCGKKFSDPTGYDEREFELKFLKGFGYPEGGQLEGWEVHDLCDDCVERLRVMLVSAGVKVSKKEVDW